MSDFNVNFVNLYDPDKFIAFNIKLIDEDFITTGLKLFYASVIVKGFF